MAADKAILARIKTDLRINHAALDEDISDTINSCLSDLAVCGVVSPDPMDPSVMAAVKLYCRAAYTDDTDKADSYNKRYGDLKACLMMAEGYGGNADE